MVNINIIGNSPQYSIKRIEKIKLKRRWYLKNMLSNVMIPQKMKEVTSATYVTHTKYCVIEAQKLIKTYLQQCHIHNFG
jgi:hypothetical protein